MTEVSLLVARPLLEYLIAHGEALDPAMVRLARQSTLWTNAQIAWEELSGLSERALVFHHDPGIPGTFGDFLASFMASLPPHALHSVTGWSHAPSNIYNALVQWWLPRLAPALDVELRPSHTGYVELEVRLAAEDAMAPALLELLGELWAVLPTLTGSPLALVDTELLDRGSVYLITPPPPMASMGPMHRGAMGAAGWGAPQQTWQIAQSLHEEKQAFVRERRQIQSQYDALLEQLQGLRESVDETRRERHQLRHDLDDTSQQVEHMGAQIAPLAGGDSGASWSAEIDALRSALGEERQANASLRQDFDALRTRFDDLKQAHEVVLGQRDTLVERVEALEEAREVLLHQRDALQQRVDALEDAPPTLMDLGDLDAALAAQTAGGEAFQEIQTLTEQLDVLQANHETLQEHHQVLSQQRDALQDRYLELEQAQEVIAQQRNSLQEQVESLQAALDEQTAAATPALDANALEAALAQRDAAQDLAEELEQNYLALQELARNLERERDAALLAAQTATSAPAADPGDAPGDDPGELETLRAQLQALLDEGEETDALLRELTAQLQAAQSRELHLIAQRDEARLHADSLGSAVEERDHLRARMIAITAQLDDAHQARDLAQARADQLGERFDVLEDHHMQITLQRDALQQRHDELEAQLEEQAAQLIVARQRVETLTERAEALEAQHDVTLVNLEVTQQQRDSLVARVAALEEQLDEQGVPPDEAAELPQLREEIEQLRTHRDKLAAQLDEQALESLELEERSVALQQSLDEVGAERDTFKARAEELAQEHMLHNATIEQMSSQLLDTQRGLEEVSISHEVSQEQLIHARDEYATLKRDHAQLRQRHEEMLGELNTLRLEINALEEQRAQLSQERAHISTTLEAQHAERDALAEKLAGMEEEHETLQIKLDELEAQLQAREGALQRVTSERDEALELVSEARVMMDRLESSAEEISTMQLERDDALERIAQFQRESASLVDQLNALTSERDELATQLEQENSEVIRLSGELTGWESQNERDQMALKDARDRAARAERLISIFLDDIRVELRAPLEQIARSSAALARASAEEAPHLLTDVQLAIGEIKLAISHLFDLNDIERGELTLDRKPLSMKRFIDEIGIVLKPRYEARRNQLLLTCDPAVETATVDVSKLRKILHHLLSNASLAVQEREVRMEVKQLNPESGPALAFAMQYEGGRPTEDDYETILAAPELTEADDVACAVRHTIAQAFVDLMHGTLDYQEVAGTTLVRVHLPLT